MAKVRGYSSYRGRGPMWKVIAAAFLAAVIMASLGVFLLQQNIVYDTGGNARLVFPWQRTQDESGTPDDTSSDVPDSPSPGVPDDDESAFPGGTESESAVAEDPEPLPPPDTFRVYAVQAAPVTEEVYWNVAGLAEETGYEAVSVLLKDTEGMIYFDAPSALSGTVRTRFGTDDALRMLTGSDLYTIAAVNCFLDPHASNSNVRRYALMNTGGYIFFDGFEGGYRTNWLDPSKDNAREYLCNLVRDAASMGFREILLLSPGYPPAGQLDKIAYGAVPVAENLSQFYSEIRSALSEYDVKISMEVPKSILLDGGEDPSGLSLELIAPYVDRIYAIVEADEIERCAEAVASVRNGEIGFMPELTEIPDPAPYRYMYNPDMS